MNSKPLFKVQHPFGIAVYFTGIFLLLYFIVDAFSQNLPNSLKNQWPFAIHATLLLVLNFIHALMIIGNPIPRKTFSLLFYGVLFYFVVGLLFIQNVSHLNLKENTSFMILYPLLLGCYLLILLIAYLIKKLMHFAHENP
jgi:hypothetical protein